jgi:hypothetical protein
MKLGLMNKWYIKTGSIREMVMARPEILPLDAAKTGIDRVLDREDDVFIEDLCYVDDMGFGDNAKKGNAMIFRTECLIDAETLD